MEIRDLTKTYGAHVVFSDLNLSVPEGECTILMGPSGCGKTTLLRLVMGLEEPDRGEIRMPSHRISAVFQEDRLLEQFTVLENLQAVLGKEKAPAEAVSRHLEKVGLADCLHQKVSELSGGMKRRAAIVRACMNDYTLLLLDEPFRGLDEENREQTIRYVLEHTAGKTCMMTTHDEREAWKMGGRIVYVQEMA